MSTPIGQRKVRAKKVAGKKAVGKKVVDIKPDSREGEDEPPDETPLRLVSLEAKNAGVIKAAFIKPDGSLVVLKGENAAGKSTCLNLIGWVLCGKKAIPEEPLRRGAENGYVELELGPIGTTDVTLTAKRLINEAGTSLVLKDGKGRPIKNAASFLKGLYTDLALDPVAWLNMSDKDQAESLMAAGGLDFKELNEDRQRIYDKRTVIGRDRDHAKENMRDAQPEDGSGEFEVPEIVDVRPLQAAVESTRQRLSEDERMDETLRGARDRKERAVAQVVAVQQEIDLLQQRVTTLEAEAHAASENLLDQEHAAETLDLQARGASYDDAQSDLEDAQSRNQSRSGIAEKQERLESTTATYESKHAEWDEHTTQIEEIDADKLAQLAAAKFPVEGLEVSESGVGYNGFPLSRASEAERLTVAVHVAMATPGRLRLVTIRAGSGLGPELLAVIEKAVAEKDGLALIEMVYCDPQQEGVVIVEEGWVGVEKGEVVS